MAFESIIGQKRICGYLAKTVENERTSHAYLLVGEKGVGKEAVALEFAKLLLCPDAPGCDPERCATCNKIRKLSHPDLNFIFPAPAKLSDSDRQTITESVVNDPYQRREPWSNPSISIDTIRELRRRSSYSSFEGTGRVFIIVDCERMTIEASNALLKILEEPPPGMYLLMTSSRPNMLLPTIISRCQSINFDPLSVDETRNALLQRTTVDAYTAELAARMSGGSYRNALEFLEQDLTDLQKQALEFFRSSVQSDFKHAQYVDEVMARSERDVQKIKKLLSFLILWFRDALIFREAGDNPGIVYYNQDEKDVLERFSSKFPRADLFSAIKEIENSLQLFDRNIQANMILIVLLAKLRTLIRSK